MASLVKWLKYSGARDGAGAPVASGKAYFWEAGTSDVPVTVYADPDGQTVKSQPVSLDAAGRAEVYVTSQCAIEVQSSTGTSISFPSNANSVDAAEVQVYGTFDTSVDGLGTDLATVLESIATDVVGNNGNLYNGLIVGVPGETIDTKIVTASAQGKILFLPPGTYYSVSDYAVNLTSLGLTVIGCGPGKTIISHNKTNGSPFPFTGGTYKNYISGLTISCVAATSYPFYIDGAASVTAENLTLSAASTLVFGYSGTPTGVRTIVRECEGSGTITLNITMDSATVECCKIAVKVDGDNCHVRDNLGDIVANGYGTKLANCVTSATYGAGTITVAGDDCFVVGCAGALSLTTAEDTAIISHIGPITWANTAKSCVAYSCCADGGTTGFAVSGSANGCVNCHADTNSVADFTTTSTATNVVDHGNTFISATPRVRSEYGPNSTSHVRAEAYTIYKATGSGSQTFTPNPQYPACAYRDTGAGAPFTLTVAATATTGLVDGQRMEINIANPSGFTMTITPNAQYTGPWPASLATMKYTHIDVQWCATTSKWDLVDGGGSLTYTAGMFT